MNIKNILVKVAPILLSLPLVVSCFHEPIPTCDGVSINVEAIKTDADPGLANGTIVAAVDGPAHFFTYSLNNSEFQASNKFSGLDSGNYILTVKNSWNCKGVQEIKN